ncbi:hypothetical protein AYI69_g6443 [Smittium culicis]|uniref:Uncharacterized protein n=1 Tax=Smittium culicis TaxID=133412 RepID=A0A1R1XZ56_9FUNG|nr:hypothetical protein AYI69_g6443 [Smittium culicis]
MEVQELRKEKTPRKDLKMEDENYVVMPSIVDLNVPQGLIELMPHIYEGFYKSIGSKEEIKEVIQACPRSSTMSYSPPPLNENITRAVKKTDTTLYGIRITLAQATRPLENFVYRKYKEDSEAAKEDEGVALASAMRLILASIATNICQSRMENLYQALNIPGKPKKLFQIRQQYRPYRSPSSSTTMAQTIQSGQTSDNPTYTSGFPSEPPSLGPPHDVQESLGATHGQLVAPTTENSSSPVQEEAESGSQSGTDRGNRLHIIQESNRGSRPIKPRVLKPTLLRVKESMQAVYHRGPEQAHETWAPGQLRQVGDSADTNHKSPGNDHKLPADDS